MRSFYVESLNRRIALQEVKFLKLKNDIINFRVTQQVISSTNYLEVKKLEVSRVKNERFFFYSKQGKKRLLHYIMKRDKKWGYYDNLVLKSCVKTD